MESFLKDLKIAYKPRSVVYYLGEQNINVDSRVMHSKTDLRKLNVQDCDNDFFCANKCVIFIDHEALPILEYSKETMAPSKSILDDLDEITLDNRNIVVVYSN